MNKSIRIISCGNSSLFGWLISALLAKALRHTGVKISHSIVYQTKSDVARGYSSQHGGGLTLKPDFLMSLTKLGLSESTLRAHASASYYLADEYLNWQADKHSTLVSFSPTGVNFDGVRFVHHWANAKSLSPDIGDFQSFSFNNVCASLGRFTHPIADSRSVLSILEYGLTVDSNQLHSLLRESALTLGVDEELCVDKSKRNAEVIFDCREKAPPEKFNVEKYALPVSHSLTVKTNKCLQFDQQEALALATQYVALDDGYLVSRHLFDTYDNQILFDAETSDIEGFSKQLSPLLGIDAKTLMKDLLNKPKPIGFSAPPLWEVDTSSRYTVSLAQNGFFTMMADGGLSFATTMVEEWLKRMPRESNNSLLMQHFNHSMQACFDSAFDLNLIPFYVTPERSTAFWQRNSALKRTESIQHFIELFQQTGVFPNYECYPQELDYYENVLVGLGHIPISVDPLVHGMSSASMLTKLEQLKHQLSNTAKGLPHSQGSI